MARIVSGRWRESRADPALGSETPGRIAPAGRCAYVEWLPELVVHVVVVAVASPVRRRLLLRLVGHQRLRRQHQAGDRDGVLEGGPRHLGGVDDALVEHVAPLVAERVVAL